MMNVANLALQQTPPILVPLRFFLTAPIFALFACGLGLYDGFSLFTGRWNLEVLALTHLITLGFISMVMMGAFLQLVTVLTGICFPRPQLMSVLLHGFLTLGTLCLALGFLIPQHNLVSMGWLSLSVAFGLFLLIAGYCLVKAATTPITIAMRLAILSLLITICLAIVLARVFSHGIELNMPEMLTNLHLVWGLIGWVSLLIIGIAYQVVPMFHVTPHYPQLLMKWLVPTLFLTILTWSIAYFLVNLNYLPHIVATSIGSFIGLELIIFALSTFYIHRKRLRKIPDVTLNFWHVGMMNLILSILIWYAGEILSLTAYPFFPMLLGILFLAGFILPIIQGTLYKIVPFLVWLHLQNQQMSTLKSVNLIPIPTMKQIIPYKMANYQFWVYLIGLVLLIAAIFWINLIYVAVAMLTFAFLFLGYNLYRAAWMYWVMSNKFTQ